VVALPYCWFSPIDWWTPRVCARSIATTCRAMKFASWAEPITGPISRRIAKAIEYARKRDLQAVLRYCGSIQVARKLMSEADGLGFEDGLDVRRIGKGRERVSARYSRGSYFDVKRRQSGWVITGFHIEGGRMQALEISVLWKRGDCPCWFGVLF
jgi:hypothetical protein